MLALFAPWENSRSHRLQESHGSSVVPGEMEGIALVDRAAHSDDFADVVGQHFPGSSGACRPW